jgi:hypothetical protein
MACKAEFYVETLPLFIRPIINRCKGKANTYYKGKRNINKKGKFFCGKLRYQMEMQ